MERQLERYLEAGFPRIKVKVANPVKDACRRIELMRKRAGDAIDLCVDANWAYSLEEAVEVGRALTANRYFWFEEPLRPEDEDGYVELRKRCDTPLAAGESNYTLDQAMRLVSSRTLSYLQPDVARSGGITETRRMAEFAAAHDVRYAPHIGMSGIICETASLHLAAAMPNVKAMECETDASPFKTWITGAAPGHRAAEERHAAGADQDRDWDWRSTGTPSSASGPFEEEIAMTAQTSTNDMAEALRLALLRADPQLSRFDPLPRIISLDDFSRGHCGWSQLVGNYEDDLDAMLPGYAQHTSAMLSTLRPLGRGLARGPGFLLRAEDRDTAAQRRAERGDQAPHLPQARADPASRFTSRSSPRRTS